MIDHTEFIQRKIDQAGSGGIFSLEPGCSYNIRYIKSSHHNQLWNLYGVTFNLIETGEKSAITLIHQQIKIRGLTLFTKLQMPELSGIRIFNSHGILLDDLYISGFTENGIRIYSSGVILERCKIELCLDSGIYLNGGRSCTIKSSLCHDNKISGISICNNSIDTIIDSCRIFRNYHYGISITNDSKNVIISNSLSRWNKKDGILIAQQNRGKIQYINLSNCIISNNLECGLKLYAGKGECTINDINVDNCTIVENAKQTYEIKREGCGEFKNIRIKDYV